MHNCFRYSASLLCSCALYPSGAWVRRGQRFPQNFHGRSEARLSSILAWDGLNKGPMESNQTDLPNPAHHFVVSTRLSQSSFWRRPDKSLKRGSTQVKLDNIDQGIHLILIMKKNPNSVWRSYEIGPRGVLGLNPEHRPLV